MLLKLKLDDGREARIKSEFISSVISPRDGVFLIGIGDGVYDVQDVAEDDKDGYLGYRDVVEYLK